jgi:hypothetical protein
MSERLAALLDGLCGAYEVGYDLVQSGSYSFARKAMITRLACLELGLIEKVFPSIPMTNDHSVVASQIMVFIDECIALTQQQLDAMKECA